MHVCHSHPGYLSYVVNGGQGQVQDEKGIRKIDVVSGALCLRPRGTSLQMSERQRFNSSVVGRRAAAVGSRLAESKPKRVVKAAGDSAT